MPESMDVIREFLESTTKDSSSLDRAKVLRALDDLEVECRRQYGEVPEAFVDLDQAFQSLLTDGWTEAMEEQAWEALAELNKE